jgi:hypothetical protein
MRSRLWAVLTIALFVTACKGSPATPSGSYLGKPPVALRLTAPAEIEPGQSAQLVATVVKSDGSIAEVTRDVRWTLRSTPTSTVILLTADGLALARDRGQVVITAHLGVLTADASILVIPRGTFMLTGRVTEQGSGLQGVQVTVVAGTGSGLLTRTNQRGDYELYGVAGPIHLRATKDGYLDRAAEVQAVGHGTLDFELSPFLPSLDYAGLYTLLVTGESCSSDFPPEGKLRVYTARVQQEGARLQVALSGARFISAGVFAGFITPDGGIKFIMRPESPWDYDALDVWERLSDGTELLVRGVVHANRTTAGISRKPQAQDEGTLWLTRNPYVWCQLDRFEMVPR